MTDYTEKLAASLRQLRLDKSAELGHVVTQREAADDTGVSPAAMSHYESGFTGMRVETACKLADYYGVTLDELCGREAR